MDSLINPPTKNLPAVYFQKTDWQKKSACLSHVNNED